MITINPQHIYNISNLSHLSSLTLIRTSRIKAKQITQSFRPSFDSWPPPMVSPSSFSDAEIGIGFGCFFTLGTSCIAFDLFSVNVGLAFIDFDLFSVNVGLAFIDFDLFSVNVGLAFLICAEVELSYSLDLVSVPSDDTYLSSTLLPT